MATNVILEYKRSADEWQCPICDAENSMALTNCSVCGGTKTADATILRRWTPTPAAPPVGRTPAAKRPDYGPMRTFDEPRGPITPEKESKSGCITGLMIILVVLILFLAIFLLTMQSQAKELSFDTAEYSSEVIEPENMTEYYDGFEDACDSGRYEYVL